MVNVFDSVGWRRNSVLCKLYALQVVILLVLCNVATSNKNNSDNNIIPVFLNFDYGASNRSTPALQTIYALAIEHFNERRSDILPWLDRVKTCPVQLQPITCASFCSPQSALQNMLDVLSKVNFVGAISGVQCENEAGPLAVLANSFGSFPSVSGELKSFRLSDRDWYPRLARTNPDFTQDAQMITSFLEKLKYTSATLVISSDDPAGQLLSQSFTARAIERKFRIANTIQLFLNNTDASFAVAARTIVTNEVNVLVVVLNSTTMEKVANAFELLTSPTHLNLKRNKLLLNYVTDDDDFGARLANAKQYFQGSLLFQLASIPPYSTLGRFGSLLQMGNFSKIPKTQLSPNSPTCFTNATVFESSTQSRVATSIRWGFAYDAVVSIGLAACAVGAGNVSWVNNKSNASAMLWDEILKLDARLMTNRVRFDVNGDRVLNDLTYEVVNYFQPNNPGARLQFAVVARSDSELDWEMTNNIVYKDGSSTPPFIVTPPLTQFNSITTGLRILGYFEFALIVCLCLICSAWLVVNWNQPHVRNVQPFLLMLMLVGVFVSSSAILTLTIDDANEFTKNINVNAACMATPILFFIGLLLSLVSLVAKMYRIFKIFKNQRLKRVYVSTSHLFGVIFLCMLLEGVLFLLWIVLDPLKWERISLLVDRDGFALYSVGSCTTGRAGGVILSVLITIKVVLLLLMLVLANQIKDCPTEYQESKFINYSVFFTSQLFFVGVPAMVAAYDFPTGRFIIATTVVTLNSLSMLGFILLPKIYPRFVEMISNGNQTLSRDNRKEEDDARGRSPPLPVNVQVENNNNNNNNLMRFPTFLKNSEDLPIVQS